MEYCGRDGLGCGMGTQRSGVHAENGGAGRPSRGWVPELRQAREPKYGGGAARLRRGRAAMSRATAATAASVRAGETAVASTGPGTGSATAALWPAATPLVRAAAPRGRSVRDGDVVPSSSEEAAYGLGSDGAGGTSG
jgi:hypothetical protein